MSNRRIVVYGAGGHGKVVADILLAGNAAEFAGFVDDYYSPSENTVLGFEILGGGQWLLEHTRTEEVFVALGVGDNLTRRELGAKCLSWNIKMATLVHPRATVAASAILGRGSVVMAGAVINAQAKIGLGVIVNSGAVVEHDVEIGDYAHVSPNATLGGAARLGALSHLGLGAVILPRVAVGSNSVVGAGAVVLKDLPDSVVAAGVPARILRRLSSESKNRSASELSASKTS